MKYFLLSLLLLSAAAAHGQDYGRYWNIYGGMGRSRTIPEGQSRQITDMEPLLVPRAGMTLAWAVGDHWRLIFGLEYQQIGYRSHMAYTIFSNPLGYYQGPVDVRHHQLLLPLEGRFQTDLAPKWRLGIQGGIAIGGTVRTTVRSNGEDADPAYGRFSEKKDLAYGRLKADISRQITSRLFLVAGPSYLHSLSKGEKYRVLSFDAGLGFGY